MLSKKIYYYYGFLLLVLCSWTSDSATPPMALRIAYLIALFMPAILTCRTLIPPVIMCFTAIAGYGFSCSFMPTEYFYYTYTLLAMVLLTRSRNGGYQTPPRLFVFYVIYVLIIDFITNSKLENIGYSTIAVMLSFYFVSKDLKERSMYPLALTIVTCAICFFFFVFGDNYVDEIEGIERIGWKDPNYLGMVTGMGIVVAYNEILNNQNLSKPFRIFYLLTVCVGILMLAVNASRGAALATMTSLVILTFFSNIKTSKKTLLILGAILFIFALYNLNAFGNLIQRVQEDDGNGNGRKVIWAYKFNGWLEGTTLEHYFGMGYSGGFKLGTIGGYGFHNDFLAHLVDYGIVGICLFISLLLHPVILAWHNYKFRIQVISMIIFISIGCFTLEPLTAGRMAFFFFYMYIILIARYSKQSK